MSTLRLEVQAPGPAGAHPEVHGNLSAGAPTVSTDVETPRAAVITSKRNTYTTHEHFARGHVAEIYLAHRSLDGRVVVLKVAADPAHNALLDNEFEHLRAFEAFASETAGWRSSVPRIWRPTAKVVQGWQMVIEDAFKIRGHRANVLYFSPRKFSLEEILGTLGPLPLSHALRIYASVLLVLDLFHELGRVHCAVLPEHILVPPTKGAVTLIDYCYATMRGAKLRTFCPSAQPYYPPEVLRGRPVSPATDIYMATACLNTMLGAQDGVAWAAPPDLRKFISDTLQRRPESAMHQYAELHRLARKLSINMRANLPDLDLPDSRI